jgi:hypothetical protein
VVPLQEIGWSKIQRQQKGGRLSLSLFRGGVGGGGHRYGELMTVHKKMREDAYGSGQLIQSRLGAANHR